MWFPLDYLDCTLPPEYCRYNSKLYPKCLEWMKENQPNLFAEEIKDLSGTLNCFPDRLVSSVHIHSILFPEHINPCTLICHKMPSERDPKTAKKTVHLWDESHVEPEQKSNGNQSGKKGKRNRRKKKKNASNDSDEEPAKAMKERTSDSDPELSSTKKVKILEEAVNAQQHNANDQMADIQSKLDALSMGNGDGDDWNRANPNVQSGKYSTSPRSSILKNRENPNLEAEREALNSSQLNSDDDSALDSDAEEQRKIAEFMGVVGNKNRAAKAPSRKELKMRRKKGKQNKKAEKRQRGKRVFRCSE